MPKDGGKQPSPICRSSTTDKKVNETERSFSARMSQGRSAHYMGYRFWYLALRAAGNTPRDPAALGLLWGYIGAAVRREAHLADADALAYIRRQQSLRNLPIRVREARGRRA